MGLTKKCPNMLDPVNQKIIQALENNARLSRRKLASTLGITTTILKTHIRKLEDEGVIIGYAPIVDSAKMGYAVTAVIMIQVDGNNLAGVGKELAKENNVFSVYEITGDYDIVVVAKFRDNAGLNVFIKRLLAEPFIKRSTTFISSGAVKEYSKIP